MKHHITEIIRKKRGGESLNEAELTFLLNGYLSGEIRDYHMSAWLMAVYFQGMTPMERSVWSRLMWRSGMTLPRPSRMDTWIDKHSTGGVGDKTSLILVPLVQQVAEKAFGKGAVKLPMVSGRGLDFTGGTLDKLESVPGFSSQLALPKAMELLESQGFFMMGQTADLAPADRMLYALRDVTATVECLPLIVSSILSKKLAENLDGLVFDVKYGSGAFMPELRRARELAIALCETARAESVQATAVITSMDQPLGRKVGHRLEVEECYDYLLGVDRDAGLHTVTVNLAVEMLILASRGKWRADQAEEAVLKELSRQDATKVFIQLFESQGGRWTEFEKRRERAEAIPKVALRAPEDGFVISLDARGVGRQVRAMGGGRHTKEDSIDLDCGAIIHRKVGDAVKKGDVVLEWVASSERALEVANHHSEKILEVAPERVAPLKWIEEILRA